MSIEGWIQTDRGGLPPVRDLPPGRLADRAQHLLNEVARSDLNTGQSRVRFERFRPDRRLQRRNFAVLFAAIVAGALIATPAFGLQTAIFELLGRKTVDFSTAVAAPSVVKRDFADMAAGAPAGMDPRIISGEARLVGTFDYGASKRQLWVAPRSGGGFCYAFERISGGCESAERPSRRIAVDGSFVMRPGQTEPALHAITGKVYAANAVALTLRFEDGKTVTLPFYYVSAPINAGFFAYKPTAAEEIPGHRPTELAAVAPQGDVLGRETFDWEAIGADVRQRMERHGRAVDKQNPTTIQPTPTATTP